MSQIRKDGETERPIPFIWRPPIKAIVDQLVFNQSEQYCSPFYLKNSDQTTNKIIRENIENYPEEIGLLNYKSWDTSIYIWMDTHWDILIDLSDINGDTTDLVLSARIYEHMEEYLFAIHLVYVP